MEHAVALRQDHLVLGRYRPLRPLGSGGSGSVWLVRDERSARDVALKVVPREGKAGSRAEREVEAATRLRHPRCLRALALERDDRHVYVAYEYIPGRTLREALRHGELDDADAGEAGAQMLEALAHAHSKGVVHRDVKPANVMLEESENVSVRVLDFGLAQLEEADTLTAVGDVPGTLAYIAPERLAGHDATGAADVWSVGVFLWEALAGRHPFSAISPLETARRVAAGAPSLVALRPDLPRRLTATVDAMLSGSRAAARGEGSYGGSAVWLLPFFPPGWPVLVAAVAALAGLWSPAAGLGFALAIPILPLGNLSLGLALVYAAFALVWFALFAGDARAGFLFLLGPVLAPAHALVLLPALVLSARGALRRSLLAAAAVPAAAVVAVLTETPLPFTGEEPPATLGLAGSPHPGRAADAISAFFSAHPAL